MITTDDYGTAGSILGNNTNIQVDERKPLLNNLSKYFVKDILNILESPMKGSKKLKEVRRRMYGYLKNEYPQ